MVDLSATKAMLNIITDATATALAYVDKDGKLTYVCFNRRSEKYLQYYKGKSFRKLIRLLFGEASELLWEAYLTCASSLKKVQVTRFKYQSVRNTTEYFDWRFIPAADNSVVVYICNVAETVYLEQEIAAIMQQNEVTNRQLHVAVSKIDFQLMDLDITHRRLAALYRITSIVQHTVNEQSVMDEIVEGITTEFGFPRAAILIVDEERKELVSRASRGGYSSNIRIPYGRGVTWRALLSREMVYIPDISKEPDYVSSGCDLGVSEIAIPLYVADKAIGVLDIESSEDQPIQPHDLTLLQSLASQVALTIVHAQHVTRMEIQAITDALTGLYNYRYFLDLLDREYKRAVRYNRPMSLIMLDIDYFKHYNDTYGHLQGNEVLRLLAGIIKNICREVDSPVRYGGEEFVLLLPETSISEAITIAERIRRSIANHPFSGGHTQPKGAITVSIGVSGYPEAADCERKLLENADTALYIAKKSNRNCIVVYPDPLPLNI